MSRLVLLFLVVAVAGCVDERPACIHPHPRGTDCSYGLGGGLAATASFEVAWDGDVAAEGLQAMGFSIASQDARRVTTATNDSGVSASALRWAPQEGPESVRVQVLFPSAQSGIGYTREEAEAMGMAAVPAHEEAFTDLLARFEAATGWRHANVSWGPGLVVA